MTWTRYLVMTALAIFFALFMFLPLYTVIAEGLNIHYMIEALRHPIYSMGLVNTLLVGIVTTLMVFLLGVPLAFLNDRYDFFGKSWVSGMMLLPMILPPFVGALGFHQIFGKLGALNSLLTQLGFIEFGQGPDWLGGNGRFWIVCLIEALHLYPILYLNAATALGNIDPSLNEAAENLGCNAFTRFRRITLPLVRPGLFAGGIIVFIWSFTELGTPLMLGYHRVTPVQIFNGVTELGSNPLPYALVFILLILAGGLYIISRLLFGQEGHATVLKGAAQGGSKPLHGWHSLLAFLPFVLVTMLATLPHLGVILLSISRDWYGTVLPTDYTLVHFQDALSHSFVVPSIINSLKYSSLAMVVCVAAGLSIAILVVRWKPKGWQIFDILSMMPLAVPGIILAFGYLSMATRYDILRQLMNPVENPTVLLILAYGMRRLPYVVRAACAGLEQTPRELEHAAANLGASGLLTLRRIVIPLITANIIAGVLFAFAFSMLEVSDSLILAQKSEFFPITRAIYELSAILGSGPYIACAFGVWAMLFLATTIFVATRLLGRRIGAMFRF